MAFVQLFIDNDNCILQGNTFCLEIYLLVIRDVILRLLISLFISGITFSTGGSFNETHKTLSAQALKAIFKLNQYLFNFTDISPKHTLELFDKLIVPILCYGSEVWGFLSLYNKRECIFNFVRNY